MPPALATQCLDAPSSGPVAIGLDVGSTTVKAVVVDVRDRSLVWRDYARHHTRQPETVIAFLERIEADLGPAALAGARIFATGSGAGPLCGPLGARFVQEVNAVAMAVEALHPDVRSVIELGGQDAKILMFKENVKTGDKQAWASMNDKCASGTGATIDKCFVKAGVPIEVAQGITFNPDKLHHVAAKCGVFAETDIVNLVKTGIPGDEILNSLADAIVMQNLSVLTRGNTLQPKVLLLGGPNTFLPFLVQAWRLRIPEIWRERGAVIPEVPVQELIFVPERSELYAALGAVYYGLDEPADVGIYQGLDDLRAYAGEGRKARLAGTAGPPLAVGGIEVKQFVEAYAVPKFFPPHLPAGTVLRAALGLDGGSTSSKCVLVAEDGTVLWKEYQLSKGNPIVDMRQMLGRLRDGTRARGWLLDIVGFGVTGYAGPVLEKVLRADAHVVETIAHMRSAVGYFGDVDVVCDIGGQDIKVLFLKHGDVDNFKLSNQCSAGNGMLLQAMADQFGVPVTEYADTAFSAELSPSFSYGCAVFLDADRVNFQKEGYSKEEMLAGLALVLPKNVWQYVVSIPRMAELGRTFVLQGGTQYNLAAVKAQVDYIRQRVPGAVVRVHPHPGEAGAIGAALEVWRKHLRTGQTAWIGLDAAIGVEFTATTDASTRCHFCPNLCSRTFIDTVAPTGDTARYIAGFSCEKGTVEDEAALKILTRQRAQLRKAYPNLVEWEAKALFSSRFAVPPLPDAGSPIEVAEVKVDRALREHTEQVRRGFQRSSEAAQERRKTFRVGIPKVLNIWSIAPFLRTYLEALGIERHNVVFSDDTSEELWARGGKYGSIDPCFPSKVGQAHIHHLLFETHTHKALDAIWLPAITHVPSPLTGTMDHASCPIVQGAPDVLKAAFTKEKDWFAERNVRFVDGAMTYNERFLLRDQLWRSWGKLLDITPDENRFAVEQAFTSQDDFQTERERRGRILLDAAEAEDRVVLLVLGRPYHSDPGLNHGIAEEFQALGYPVLSMGAIPRDRAWLARFFGGDLTAGLPDVFDINDVWPENYSANSALKVWCAKFAARHPNVAVLDLSSFKCGHDAPVYATIDKILAASKTPASALHDIDANKPGGSMGIRVRTYAYTLERQRERLADLRVRKDELAAKVEARRQELIAQFAREHAERLAKTAAVPAPSWPAAPPITQAQPHRAAPAATPGRVSLGRLFDKAKGFIQSRTTP
ncbi:MAG: CoA activase [Deltaproteobacteria bacterium]|nr:CoA activase [Deltaproteobacteria bacterium]